MLKLPFSIHSGRSLFRQRHRLGHNCLRAIVWIVLVAALGLPSTASAFSSYTSKVPNGAQISCGLCHPGSNTQQLNTFALDFNAASSQWGPAFAALDSDGDGFTNGVELGDPAGIWALGQIPSSTTGITNAGDSASFPPPPAPSVPLLSMWGLLGLIGVVFASGSWVLHDRVGHS